MCRTDKGIPSRLCRNEKTENRVAGTLWNYRVRGPKCLNLQKCNRLYLQIQPRSKHGSSHKETATVKPQQYTYDHNELGYEEFFLTLVSQSVYLHIVYIEIANSFISFRRRNIASFAMFSIFPFAHPPSILIIFLCWKLLSTFASSAGVSHVLAF